MQTEGEGENDLQKEMNGLAKFESEAYPRRGGVINEGRKEEKIF